MATAAVAAAAIAASTSPISTIREGLLFFFHYNLEQLPGNCECQTKESVHWERMALMEESRLAMSAERIFCF